MSVPAPQVWRLALRVDQLPRLLARGRGARGLDRQYVALNAVNLLRIDRDFAAAALDRLVRADHEPRSIPDGLRRSWPHADGVLALGAVKLVDDRLCALSSRPIHRELGRRLFDGHRRCRCAAHAPAAASATTAAARPRGCRVAFGLVERPRPRKVRFCLRHRGRRQNDGKYKRRHKCVFHEDLLMHEYDTRWRRFTRALTFYSLL